MGFCKILCSIWASKNDFHGRRLTFSELFNKTFQENSLIPVHVVARGNHKLIINEGFSRYLDKVQNIISADKGILHQWLQGVFFHCISIMQAQ